MLQLGHIAARIFECIPEGCVGLLLLCNCAYLLSLQILLLWFMNSMNNGQMDCGNENSTQHFPWWPREAMTKSQPCWLGPGFDLGTSQIRVQCVAPAPPHSVAQFLFRRISSRSRFCCEFVKEENLFLNLADAIKVSDFHFNLEFVLFGVFR